MNDPWPQITHLTQSMTSTDEIWNTIHSFVPGFRNQLVRDASASGLLEAWGISKNLEDGHPEHPLVPVNLLKIFASTLDVNTGHAGLNHTYGYLFSTLPTPFGYKRARYIEGEIEAGFGLSQAYFSGQYPQGSLLSNFTSFLTPLVFREMGTLKIDFCAIDEILHYPYADLQPQRLVEVAQNEFFYLEMRTDIVPFHHINSKGNNSALLIYSVDYRKPNQPSNPRLMTAFPVQESFSKGLFDPTRMGDSQPLQLKYNSVLPDSSISTPIIGKRFLYHEDSH